MSSLRNLRDGGREEGRKGGFCRAFGAATLLPACCLPLIFLLLLLPASTTFWPVTFRQMVGDTTNKWANSEMAMVTAKDHQEFVENMMALPTSRYFSKPTKMASFPFRDLRGEKQRNPMATAGGRGTFGSPVPCPSVFPFGPAHLRCIVGLVLPVQTWSCNDCENKR